MKTILFCCCLLAAFFSRAQSFYGSDFYRLNDNEFKVVSFFTVSNSNCFGGYQVRAEEISNDTLFLRILFEMRVPTLSDGCNRLDTISRTNQSSDIHFINVSTGRIKFDTNDITVGDTSWAMYDSTFNAVVGLPDLAQNRFDLHQHQQQLTVSGSEEISNLQLIDLNGKELLFQEGNKLDISLVCPGIYLLRVFSGSGNTSVVRWYKE